jgi:hypothetical protein
VKRDLFWLAKLPDAHGNSVYDRLAEVLLVILKERPENPIEKFESLLGRINDAEMDAAYVCVHVCVCCVCVRGRVQTCARPR